MLYDADRHESLRSVSWDEDVVRGAINDIVTDAIARYSPTHLWPLHPKDFEAGDDMNQPALPM